MKKLIFGNLLVAMAISLGAPATGYAQDWTGGYVGVNAGWGWSNIDTKISPVGADSTADFNKQSLSTNANGGIFGAHAGYNWQMDKWVLGVEGDFDGASVSGSDNKKVPGKVVPTNTIDGFQAEDKVKWLASVRGRAGYLAGPGMLYATGGVAWENLKRNSMVNANVAPAIFGVTGTTSDSSTRSGWVLGAGYEWMMTRNISLRGEYLHYHFGSSDSDSLKFGLCGAGPGTCGAKISTDSNNINALRVGVSYKF
jgi:outer membrane immunogenic protein